MAYKARHNISTNNVKIYGMLESMLLDQTLINIITKNNIRKHKEKY